MLALFILDFLFLVVQLKKSPKNFWNFKVNHSSPQHRQRRLIWKDLCVATAN